MDAIGNSAPNYCGRTSSEMTRLAKLVQGTGPARYSSQSVGWSHSAARIRDRSQDRPRSRIYLASRTRFQRFRDEVTHVGYVLLTAQDRPPVSSEGNAVAWRLGFFSLEERVELLEAVGPAAAMQL
jgi:hypothetical protein